MDLWLSYGFRRIVRDNVGGREERVWERFDLYLRRPNEFDGDRRNNDYKLLDTYTVGANSCKVFKYRIDDGSRLFLVQLDAAMAGKVRVVRQEGEECATPQAGDYCFIGVTGTDKHDKQGSYGAYFAKRFLI